MKIAPIRVGVFDIETSHFEPQWGIFLCGCVLDTHSGKITTVRADQFPAWKTERHNDAAAIKAFQDELAKYHILIAHNGVKFDIPYINAKCLQHGIEPILHTKKIVDPYKITRFKVAGRSSLKSLQYLLELKESKTPITPLLWTKAAIGGSSKALDEIVVHCRQDVKVLNEVASNVMPLVTNIDPWGSSR